MGTEGLTRREIMDVRVEFQRTAPDGFNAMVGLEKYLAKCSVEPILLHLVKLRASQINGCAYCIDMHWKDLRAIGETEQRLYGLDAWRESPYYTARERAALEWTEAVTLITSGHVPDSVYESVRTRFNEKELADLTFAVATINAWNRMSISLRTVPGSYEPPRRARATGSDT
jgi:AhpD family alkylhydroperoxidase